MQEEVESRTVNLAISTSKLSARTIVSAVRAYLNHRKNVKAKKEHEAEIPTQGKQSVKELIGQGQGVTNIDISKTDLKGFEKVARSSFSFVSGEWYIMVFSMATSVPFMRRLS